MTEILINWLNDDVGLSKHTDKSNFELLFANGYLFGEILAKHALQPDFPRGFLNDTSMEVRLANWKRLEPGLRRLNIPFDSNAIRDIMAARPGVAARFAYQLYVTLVQRPGAAPPHPHPSPQSPPNDYFVHQLTSKTPRQVDVNFQRLEATFHDKYTAAEALSLRKEAEAESAREAERKQKHAAALDRTRAARAAYNEKVQGWLEKSPALPPVASASGERPRSRDLLSSTLRPALPAIGTTHTQLAPISRHSGGAPSATLVSPATVAAAPTLLQRCADPAACGVVVNVEREQRRRARLVAHQAALEATCATATDAQYTRKAERQAACETALFLQLTDIAAQEHVFRQHRIAQTQAEHEQRQRDLAAALAHEGVLARERLAANDALVAEALADMASARHRAALALAADTRDFTAGLVRELCDLAIKTAQYRVLTSNNVPAHMEADWAALFAAGGNLSAQSDDTGLGAEPAAVVDTLNARSWLEYSGVTGEWGAASGNTGGSVGDGNGDGVTPATACLAPNPIFTHVLDRISAVASTSTPSAGLPAIPPCPLQVAVIGKPFAGVTSTVARHVRKVRSDLAVLNVAELAEAALVAWQQGELGASPSTVVPAEEEKPSEQPLDAALANLSLSENSAPLESPPQPPQPPLSTRAQLGAQVSTAWWIDGVRVLSDDLCVALIIDALERLPAVSGWLLDGFPANVAQLRLFETRVTGVDAGSGPGAPLQALHGIVLLETEEDEALRRANGFISDPETGSTYHLRSAPAPVSLETLGLQARLVATGAPTGRPLDALPAALTQSHTNLTELRAYLHPSAILAIDAGSTQTLDTIDAAFESALDTLADREAEQAMAVVMAQTLHHDTLSQALAAAAAETKTLDDQTNLVANELAQDEATAAALIAAEAEAAAAAAAANPKSAKGKKVPAKPPASAKKKGKDTGPVLPTYDALQAGFVAAEALDAPRVPEPGDVEYEALCPPVNREIAVFLHPLWQAACSLHKKSSLLAFTQARRASARAVHYLYARQQEFASFLSRPDHKQEFVAAWQDAHNALPGDMRNDDETKAEMHKRVEELHDTLASICATRESEGHAERDGLRNNLWFETHQTVLANAGVTLLQAELALHVAAAQVLADYYHSGVGGAGVAAPLEPSTVLPLLALPASTVPNVADGETAALEPKSASGTKTASPLTPPMLAVDHVPVFAQPPSTTTTTPEDDGGKAVDPAVAAPTVPVTLVASDNGQPGSVLLTFLAVVDAALAATCVAGVKPSERRAAEAAQREKDAAAAAAAAAKGKKGKTPAAPPAPVLTAEEQAAAADAKAKAAEALALAEKLEDEAYAARVVEEARYRARVGVARERVVGWLNDAATRLERTLADMTARLDARILAERSSIAALAHHARVAIEAEALLPFELVLTPALTPGSMPRFSVDKHTRLFPVPDAAPRAAPIEAGPALPPPLIVPMLASSTSTPLVAVPLVPSPPAPPQRPVFLVTQLVNLAQQFSAVSGPTTSMLPVRRVVALVSQLAASGLASNAFPRGWRGTNPLQLSRLCTRLSPDGGQLVDWRLLVLSLADLPAPTLAQLLAARKAWTGGKAAETVDRAAVLATSLWFEPLVVPAVVPGPGLLPPSGPGAQPLLAATSAAPYNRGLALKHLLLDLAGGPGAAAVPLGALLALLCRAPPPAGFWHAVTLHTAAADFSAAGDVCVRAEAVFRALLDAWPALARHPEHPLALANLQGLLGPVGRPMDLVLSAELQAQPAWQPLVAAAARLYAHVDGTMVGIDVPVVNAPTTAAADQP